MDFTTILYILKILAANELIIAILFIAVGLIYIKFVKPIIEENKKYKNDLFNPDNKAITLSEITVLIEEIKTHNNKEYEELKLILTNMADLGELTYSSLSSLITELESKNVIEKIEVSKTNSDLGNLLTKLISVIEKDNKVNRVIRG